jgi:hypothetical protein
VSIGDRDLLNPNVMRDGMHDWVEANNRMAKVLKAKGYHYQYLFCRNAGHSVSNAQAQFLPHAIEWVWNGYTPKKTDMSFVDGTERMKSRLTEDPRVVEATVTVQGANGGHFISREFEVEQRQILNQPFRAHTLGNDRRTALYGPAEHHLRRRLAMALGGRANNGLLEHRVLGPGHT